MSQLEELESLKKKATEALEQIEKQYSKGLIDEEYYQSFRRKFQKYIEVIDAQIKSIEEESEEYKIRKQLYSNDEVQILLTEFLDGDLNALYPIFDVEYGVRYPQAEEIMGTGPKETLEILKDLEKAGILVPKIHEKGIKCPRCKSNRIVVQYVCPYCHSANFDKGIVIEHYKCGNMDFEINFKKEREHVCPKCNTVLEQIGKDYAKMGPWFKCNDCKKFFEEPAFRHYCAECKAIFELKDALFVNLYAYYLNDKLIKEIESVIIPVKKIIEKVKELGWTAKSPAYIVGNSGMIHRFLMAFWYTKSTNTTSLPINPTAILSVATSKHRVEVEKVLEFFAKAHDVDAPLKILVGIPRFESKAFNLASSYGITLLEARDRNNVVKRVVEFLETASVPQELIRSEEETKALKKVLDELDKKLSK
ncbi:MAG: hypothetical protein ACTSSJ_01520 [Candidatus Odinarchaeia archaeon]